MTAFWDVALCSRVEVYGGFRGACYRAVGKILPNYTTATSQKTVIFILVAVRTLNLTTYDVAVLFIHTVLFNSIVSSGEIIWHPTVSVLV
jgi:hypothetical protein